MFDSSFCSIFVHLHGVYGCLLVIVIVILVVVMLFPSSLSVPASAVTTQSLSQPHRVTVGVIVVYNVVTKIYTN